MLSSPIRSPIRSAVSGVFERMASGGAAVVGVWLLAVGAWDDFGTWDNESNWIDGV